MLFAVIFLSFALVAVVAWSVVVYRRQQAIIRGVQREKVKIKAEERHVFDFLHDVGEALTHESRPSDLHASIVEGALRILEAQGGALYLADKTGKQLRPAYISKACPPFVELPKSSGPLLSQLKLQAVRTGDGLIGGVPIGNIALFLPHSDARLSIAREHGANSAFLAPLTYAGQSLGVLAVSRGGVAEEFGGDDFATFKALAEQSAFSLYDAFLHHEAAEKRQIERDLKVANEVQRVLLPSEPPCIEGYEVSGTNIPARYVSGDYFDFIPLDEDRWGIAIADVSGKGVSAALMMAMVRCALRMFAPTSPSPAEVLQRLNAQLYPDIKEDMFISMAYAIMDRREPTIQMVRAGHDAPLLYRARDGSVEMVKPPGMAVGIDSGVSFNRVTHDFSLLLEPGDCFVFYTDGVTEALDRNGEEFGMEAMIRAVKASAPEGAASVIQRVTDDVRAFAGDHPLHDDITMIVIRKK